MLIIAMLIYAFAMTVANLLVVAFGPVVTPINSFLLIGLDLTLRDWLHMRLKFWQMASLIACSGGLTYLLNPAAGQIAIASAVAFTAAASVDFAVFSRMTGSWIRRSNFSNIFAAGVDSIIFPTIAFGSLIPIIVLSQFIAKIVGGAIWAFVFVRVTKGNNI